MSRGVHNSKQCDGAVSVIQTLLKRKQVVDCLRDGITQKREIEEAIDISRPTIDRSIRDLEELGAVVRRNGSIEFTLYGLFIVNKFRNMLNTYQTFTQVRPLLLSLPSETHLTMDVLEEAEVTVPEEYAPHEPLRSTEESLKQASEVKVIAPTIIPRQIELLSDRVINSDLDCELLVREAAVDVLLSDGYHETIEELLENNCSIWSSPDPANFGLMLVDLDTVHIIGYSNSGGITAVITTDSKLAVEWAENVFVQCRQNSEEVLFRSEDSSSNINQAVTSFVLGT